MAKQKFDIYDLLSDISCDNGLKDGDEILLTLGGMMICVFVVKFREEDICFKVRHF